MRKPPTTRDRLSLWLVAVIVIASVATYLPKLAIAVGPGAILDAYVQAKIAAGPPVQAAIPPPGADGIGLVDPTTGIWHLRTRAGDPAVFYYGNPGDYPFVGDWDCDGDETPGLYRQSDGFVYLRNSNTQGEADIRFFFGNPGDIPLAGDFNGNGCDTVSLYRPSEGRVYVINHLGQNNGGLGDADYDYYFGNPADKPFTGDFNGDGIDTVGLHRETTGILYFRNTNDQGNAHFEFYFGDPGDRLIAGDWTGDGQSTPGIYRPSNRTIYLRYDNTQGNAHEQFTWGNSPYVPVAGNFGNLVSGVNVSLDGATPGLSHAVESYYLEYGHGPHIPAGFRNHLAGIGDGPNSLAMYGQAAIDTVYGKQVAAVKAGSDILLGVSDNGWEWRIVGGDPDSAGRPPWFGGNTRHVALIGTDYQQNQDGSWPDPLKTNSDSVHILSLRPSEGRGVLTGIPRDTLFGTWFDDERCRLTTGPERDWDAGEFCVKIAIASRNRGVHETVNALKNESGLPIEGYFQIGFGTGITGGNLPPGFRDLVDAYGGINFHVPYATTTGLLPGDQHLTGTRALQVARERTIPPHGDVNRTLTQGLLIKAAIADIRKGSVLTIPALLALMDGYVNTDLSVDQVLTFATATFLTDPGHMPTFSAAEFAVSDGLSPYNQNQGALPNVVIGGCFVMPSGFDLVAGNYGTFSDLADAMLNIANPPFYC